MLAFAADSMQAFSQLVSVPLGLDVDGRAVLTPLKVCAPVSLQRTRCGRSPSSCAPVQAPPPEDLAFCGALEYYDKSFDRVTPKTERPLKKTQRAFRSVTTSDDPVIRRAPKPYLLPCVALHNRSLHGLLLASPCGLGGWVSGECGW